MPISDIQVGMKKREVARLLGSPDARMTAKEFLKNYESVVFLGDERQFLRQEHWMYADVPLGSHSMITFTKGRVTDVTTQP